MLDPTRHIVRGTTLKIINVQQDDRGYFECQADSKMETARDYVRVDVESRESPKLQVYPQQDQVVIDIGGVAYAQCRILEGIPMPNIQWKRQDGNDLSSRVIVSQEGSLLQIRDAQPEDFGTYICVGKNIEGTDQAQITIVPREQKESEEENQRPPTTTKQPEQPEQEDEDQQKPEAYTEPIVQVQESNAVTLYCRTRSRQADTRFYWQNPRGDYVEATEGSSGSDMATLFIENANRNDAGTYTCIVSNRFGNSRSQLELNVIYNQQENEQQQEPLIRVELSPKSRSVKQGSTVDFKCRLLVANSNKGEEEQSVAIKAPIRWSRQDESPMPTSRVESGDVLRINNVKKNDGGRYVCSITHDGISLVDYSYLEVVPDGDKENAFPVYIHVNEKPIENNANHALIGAFRFGVRITVDCVAQVDQSKKNHLII
jgi:hypothetical protein